jgi:hypothetical protein
MKISAEDRQYILKEASNNEACEEEYEAALAATDEAFMDVVRRNILWCCERDILPPSVLKTLAGDENPDVRYRVAESSLAPSEVLEALAQDKEWGVRFGVAKNQSTPAATLRMLLEDSDPSVRITAKYNPSLT